MVPVAPVQRPDIKHNNYEKTTINLLNEFKLMINRRRKKVAKLAKVTLRDKRQEVVESSGCLRHQRIWYIKEK